MEPKRRRKFTVRDGLVLIAAVAIGLAWMRESTKEIPYPMDWDGPPWSPIVRRLKVQFWWVDAFYNLLAALTIAMLWVRAFPPRRGFRRLSRQPGAVACAAASAAVSV